MLKIGCTGGIGAGKSTICKEFVERYNIPLYDMDIVAKKLGNSNESLKKELIALFGRETYVNGIYNSKHVANIVFSNKEQKTKLEQVMGKYINEDYHNWLREAEKQNPEYIIVESAIFYETKSEHLVDLMVGVICPMPIRIERVQKRNNCTYSEVMARIHAQIEESFIVLTSDYTIYNDGESNYLLQLSNLHRIFSKMGKLLIKQKQEILKNMVPFDIKPNY